MYTKIQDLSQDALRVAKRLVLLDENEEKLATELAAIQAEKTKLRDEFTRLFGSSKPDSKTNRAASGPSKPARKTPKATAKNRSDTAPKKALGATGWIHEVWTHMKNHPGVEFSPEALAEALGEPEKKSLTSTCLARLLAGKKIVRVRRGRFVLNTKE